MSQLPYPPIYEQNTCSSHQSRSYIRISDRIQYWTCLNDISTNLYSHLYIGLLLKVIYDCPSCNYPNEWDMKYRYIKCANISCGESFIIEYVHLALSKIAGSGLLAKGYLHDGDEYVIEKT